MGRFRVGYGTGYRTTVVPKQIEKWGDHQGLGGTNGFGTHPRTWIRVDGRKSGGTLGVNQYFLKSQGCMPPPPPRFRRPCRTGDTVLVTETLQYFWPVYNTKKLGYTHISITNWVACKQWCPMASPGQPPPGNPWTGVSPLRDGRRHRTSEAGLCYGASGLLCSVESTVVLAYPQPAHRGSP